jgi:hypothetical protein
VIPPGFNDLSLERGERGEGGRRKSAARDDMGGKPRDGGRRKWQGFY